MKGCFNAIMKEKIKKPNRKDPSILDLILKQLVEIQKEITVIKKDIVEIKQDTVEMKQDIAELKQDVAVLKQDVADIKKCPTIQKELAQVRASA